MPILTINMLLFGVLNAKNVLCILIKVKRNFWHLNITIWHFKHQCLAFMKLTPGLLEDFMSIKNHRFRVGPH